MDAAKEILTKIINHNNSCAAAYQYLGNNYNVTILTNTVNAKME